MLANDASRPSVTCYCDVDLVHAAYPIAGLIELADAKQIDLRFRFEDRRIREPRGTWTLWLRIEHDGRDLPVAVDLHDAVDYVSLPSLRECKWYYKVNLNERTLGCAPEALGTKLRPFGPYFPCRPRRDRAVGCRYFSNLAVKLRHRFVQSEKKMSFGAKLRDVAYDFVRHRRYQSRKVWRDYEADPFDPQRDGRDYKIVYNATCWDEAEGESIRRLNAFRAELILALRRELKDRFIGGFRNDGPSVANYPEAIEQRAMGHDEYMHHVRRSPIVVYSNGKFGCFSWRFGEAFAASRCIVSEAIPNMAGFALDEEVGCLQRSTIDDMLTTLLQLLDDPQSVATYSRRAAECYARRLRPQERMRQLISEVLQPSGSDARTAATIPG